MGKYHFSKRLSRSDTKSTDYKARKRIEELYLLTDQILHEQNHENEEYDYKLYKKYKQLKEINRKLQEKIINQHCSGCKCHAQSNEKIEKDVPFIDLTSSKNTESKKNSSIKKYRKVEASSEEEEEEAEEKEEMDTNDDVIEEVVEGDSLADLPPVLQDIIRNKVKEDPIQYTYLLKIGEDPSLCEVLRDTSSKSIYHTLKEKHIVPLATYRKLYINSFGKKTFARIRKDLREIHQLYRSALIQDS